jgi:hypothetical protein
MEIEDEVTPWVQQYWGKFPHIERDELTFICDIGTGEIGIWELAREKVAQIKDKPLLFMRGDKIAYTTDASFLDFFVRSRDGVQKFADRLEKELQKAFKRSRRSIKKSRKKTKILLGSTGANRQTLLTDEAACHDLEKWLKSVSDYLQNCGFPSDLIFFIPKEEDEANFELLATEWLVQHGDLDVTKMKRDRMTNHL